MERNLLDMIDYTEEYFEIEKDKLYSKIMSTIEDKIKVHKVKEVDKPFAYKYYFEEFIENDNDQIHFYENETYDNRTLFTLGHLEFTILERYEFYKKLYPVEFSSLFISCLTEENIEKVDTINSFDVLYHVKYYGIQYAEILVENKIENAKNTLIENELQLSSYKSYLNSRKDKLNNSFDFFERHQIKTAIEDSFIGRNEDLEKTKLVKIREKEFSDKLTDFIYLSKVMIQHDVLTSLKQELFNKYEIDINDFITGYIYDDELLNSGSKHLLKDKYISFNGFGTPHTPLNIEDWQRVQLKIFDLGIVERPKDFIVHDFASKKIEDSLVQVSENYKVPNITPINWEGSILDLETLFITLHNKGWINLFGEDKTIREDYLKTLKACFNNTDNLFSKYDFDNLGDWNKIKEFTKNNNGKKYKPRIESQLTRIFWNGNAKDLANLFIELHEHGWIVLYYKRKGNKKNNDRAFKMEGYVETIEQCFTESNLKTINTYLNPTFKEVDDINSDKWDYHYEKARVENVPSPLFSKIPKCYS